MLYVHETGFRCDDVDLSSPGALATVHRALVVDEARNTQIVADVTAALARGRNCLVLTRRVAHVDVLASLLATRGHKPLVLQGGMSASDRRAAVNRLADAKAGDAMLVIGTTPFIGEGFDAPALDSLFLAAPVSFDGLLVQCAGRVRVGEGVAGGFGVGGHLVLERGGDQVGAGRVAPVEGADPDAGLAGYVLHRHVEALFGEDLAGDGDDALPVAFGVDTQTGVASGAGCGWRGHSASPSCPRAST